MRQLSPARALGAAGLLLAACAASPAAVPLAASPRPLVVTKDLPSGRVQFALLPGYRLGATIVVPVTFAATRGSITGPVRARILASGISEGNAPAEVLVRELEVVPQTATPTTPRTVVVRWDGRDRGGALVPADAYVLVLDLRVVDGATTTDATAATTLQLNAQ